MTEVFISYSRNDLLAVRSLVEDMKRAHMQVWLDEELGGGDAWWTAILDHVRTAAVFVFALSDNSLYSKPCRAELGYAQSLGLPILPVQIGELASYRVDPIFAEQLVDYRNPTAASGFALMGALNQCSTQRGQLPDPLPEPPPIPFEYLLRLGALIHDSAELRPPAQKQTLFELRTALNDETDEGVREDIRNLLRAMRRRSDVTYSIVGEIDTLLGADPAVPSSAQEGWRPDHSGARIPLHSPTGSPPGANLGTAPGREATTEQPVGDPPRPEVPPPHEGQPMTGDPGPLTAPAYGEPATGPHPQQPPPWYPGTPTPPAAPGYPPPTAAKQSLLARLSTRTKIAAAGVLVAIVLVVTVVILAGQPTPVIPQPTTSPSQPPQALIQPSSVPSEPSSPVAPEPSSPVAPPPSHAPGTTFAAIAYSPTTGKSRMVWDGATKLDADNDAVTGCNASGGSTDCLVAAVGNYCVSLATDPNPNNNAAYSGGNGNTLAAADQMALAGQTGLTIQAHHCND